MPFRRSLKDYRYRRFAVAPPSPETPLFRYRRLDMISDGDALIKTIRAKCLCVVAFELERQGLRQ